MFKEVHIGYSSNLQMKVIKTIHIVSFKDTPLLTAGVLKEYLSHVPSTAHIISIECDESSVYTFKFMEEKEEKNDPIRTS